MEQSPSPAPSPAKSLPSKPHPKAYTTLNPPQILLDSPYTNQTLPAYLSDPHARCAWIIPIRGKPPFPGCTSASVLDADVDFDKLSLSGNDDKERSPPSSTDRQLRAGSVTWTPDALRSFWALLLSVREAQNMGAVALAFFPAAPRSARPSKNEDSHSNAERSSANTQAKSVTALHAVDCPAAL